MRGYRCSKILQFRLHDGCSAGAVLTMHELVMKELPPFFVCGQCMRKCDSGGLAVASDETDSRGNGIAPVCSWLGTQAGRTPGLSPDEAGMINGLLLQFHTRALDKHMCQRCKSVAHKRRKFVRGCARQTAARSHFFAGEFDTCDYVRVVFVCRS